MAFLRDTNRVVDSAGFGPAQFGGVVNARYGSLTYATEDAQELFTLPEGAMIGMRQIGVSGRLVLEGDQIDVGKAQVFSFGAHVAPMLKRHDARDLVPDVRASVLPHGRDQPNLLVAGDVDLENAIVND